MALSERNLDRLVTATRPLLRRVQSQADLIVSIVLCIVWNRAFIQTRGLGGADWPKELFFFAHIRHYLVRGMWPADFSIPPSLAAMDFPAFRSSHSYFANPEVFTLTPVLALLRVMEVPIFLKVLYLTFSLIGCVGVVLMARRLGFLPFFRVALVTLTALNPWVMQHWALGYTPHMNLLLTPWIAWLLLDPSRRWRSAILAGAIAALMLYQGGTHVFLWTMMGVCFFGVCELFAKRDAIGRHFGFYALFGASTLGLAAPKVIAVVRAYRGFRRGVAHGLLNIEDVIGLLTDSAPIDPWVARYNTCLWDGSLYLGWWFVVLLGVILILGLARMRLEWRQEFSPQTVRFATLCTVALLWFTCGWGDNWTNIAKVIVWLDSEIYPYRFAFLAVLALCILLISELNDLFVTASTRRRWLVLASIIPTCFAVYHHYNLHTRAATRVDHTELLRQYENHLSSGVR